MYTVLQRGGLKHREFSLYKLKLKGLEAVSLIFHFLRTSLGQVPKPGRITKRRKALTGLSP